MGLIANVFKMVIKDQKTGNVLATDKLQESNISCETEQNDVTGGGDLLAILHGRKEFTITANDPTWDFSNLAIQLGGDIKVGATTAVAMPSYEDVDTSGTTPKITLKEIPLEGTLKVYDADGELLTPVTITGKDVELPVGTANRVEVRTYKYTTSANAEVIEITSKTFPKNVEITLETLEIDFDEQPLNYIQFQFDNVKPSANFSINTSESREASVTEREFRVLKPRDSDKMGRVIKIPAIEA